MGTPKTFEDLIEQFEGERQKEQRTAHDARIRAEIWDEAASWVRILADEMKKGGGKNA